MQNLLHVLWGTGKYQHSPGNSCRHTSPCSSAKRAVSSDMAYFAINPTPWVRPRGVRNLHVRVFLYGSACECIMRQYCALWRSCPSFLSLMRGGRADLSRSWGAGIWRLQLSIGCDLGCQGDGFQKAKSVLSFQKLGCFFWSAKQGERQIQDYWLFCSVLFCFCIATQRILATEFVRFKTQGRSWRWVRLLKSLLNL